MGELNNKLIALNSFSLEKFLLIPIFKENIKVIQASPGKKNCIEFEEGLNENEKISRVEIPNITIESSVSFDFNSCEISFFNNIKNKLFNSIKIVLIYQKIDYKQYHSIWLGNYYYERKLLLFFHPYI